MKKLTIYFILLMMKSGQQRLIQAIDLLNVEEKALITLFYYEEKSIEEIGEVLKLSPGNVKVKLHRTRKKIYVLMNGKE